MREETNENFFTELLKFAIIALVIVVPIRLFVAQPFIVSGASMVPTFKSGQYLVIDELTYHFSDPKRGEVVIFRYPRDVSQFFIKRIIGLPGETVTIEGNVVTVKKTDGNNIIINESYVVNKGNGNDQTYELGPREYFVMGDNRPESSDSRIWGNVSRANLVGRAFVRLLPVQSIDVFPGKVVEQQ